MDEDKTIGIALIREGEAADALLDGRIRVIQKKRGYRFSVDALLLAHFMGPGKSRHIIDLGTGSGVIALLVSHLRPGSRIVGIEIQQELVDMARRTLAVNGIWDQIKIVEGDLRQIGGLIPPHAFDAVVSNPPYRKLLSGRINPQSEKAQARHEISGSLEDFLKAAAYALKPGGRIYLIYPARRMAELIYQMRLHRLEPKRCRMVHSSPVSRGEFILVEGVAGGGEEMAVQAPLFIYDPDGNYSSAMAALFNDLASFP